MSAEYSENINVHKIHLKETLFNKTLSLSAILIIVLLLSIFLTLIIYSVPSLKAFGTDFLLLKSWDPVADRYGAFPFLIGTLMTSALALVISTPFALAIGLFTGEYYPRGWFSSVIKNSVELLAGIPSVILGFWGVVTIVPFIRNLEIKFGAVPYGVGILTASVVLAIMITPFSASLFRLVISMVPLELKEAAYSLGASRFEVIVHVIIPYVRSGISAGTLLALGRALGETMAVTMLIGNTHTIPKGIFSTGNTMASVIANEFTEATGKIYFSSLIEIGLVLFAVTTVINIIGVKIIRRLENR